MRAGLLALVLVSAFSQLAAQTGARYLIITHDDFYDAIQPLAEWKTRKGMPAVVVKTSTTGTTSEDIREYIQDAYETWDPRPEYVLLVGGAHYLVSNQVGTGSFRTDNPYGDMSGDSLAELPYGRFPCNSLHQCSVMVAKTLAYERYPNAGDSSWYAHATTVAADFGDSDSLTYLGDVRTVISEAVANGFQSFDSLASSRGHNAGDIANSVNSGTAFVLYRGRATNYWYSPFDMRPYLEGLTNYTRLPIVYSYTCQTLSLDEVGNDSMTCNTWVKTGTVQNPCGAVAAIGNTHSGLHLAGERSAMTRGYFSGIFAESISTLGPAMLRGKLQVHNEYPSEPLEYYGWNLLGDPELNIWTTVPKPLDVDYDSLILLGPGTFSVTVTKFGLPVRNALVCIQSNSGIYQYDYTDASGERTFIIDPSVEETMRVTVTARNCVPREGQARILAAPTVSNVVPAGGEDWQVEVIHNITWTSANDTKDSLLYSTNNGTNWTFITNVNPAGGRTYAWHVPNYPSATCLVKVCAICDPLPTPVSAQSAGTFSIVAVPTVSNVVPSGGEVWQVGVTHNITWTSADDVRDSLLFSTNSGTNWIFIANVNPTGGRTYAWSVPNYPSTNCRVKVFAMSADAIAPAVSAQSAGTFSIVAPPIVSSVVPTGGEKWQSGVTHDITWTSANDARDSLLYSTNSGTNWTFIANVNPTGGRIYAWNVPNCPSTTCRVKVFAIGPDPLGPISALSASSFSIVATPTVGSLVPNGGETWVIGSHHDITWASALSITDSIVFTQDGTNWLFLGKQSPPAHTFDWNVAGPASATCKVKVFALSDDPLGGASVQSAGNFSIVAAPFVMVTAPNGGETWLATSTQNITWTSANSNTDSIVWSADNGATWSFVARQSPPGTRSYSWTVPLVCGDQNLVKVFSIGAASTVSDRSNAAFTILAPTEVWNKATDLLPGGKSKNVKDGGALAYGEGEVRGQGSGFGGDTGYVYAFKGNNTYEFYRYNTITDAWIARDSIPAIGRSLKKKGVKKGAALIVGTDARVYGAKGNNTYEFWCYDPASTWSQLNDVPTGGKALKEGTGLAAVSVLGTNYIYVLKGSGTYEFYRYKISDGSWETMANAPTGNSNKPYKYGSCLAYDGGDTIYSLKGSHNELAAYSLAGNNWVTKDTIPRKAPPGTKKTKVKDGAGMAYYSKALYALKGGNTDEFWMFSCTDQQWHVQTQLTTGSKKVKGGGALCYADGDKSLYALRGNNTLEFWKYWPTADGLGFAANGAPRDIESNSSFVIRHSSLSVTPNPCSQSALRSSQFTVSYSLPEAGNIRLTLYDVAGKLVGTLASGSRPAGSYSYSLLPTHYSLAAGVYLLKLESDGNTASRKLLLTR